MLRPLPLEKARVVVELGCGTGAMTRALLKQLPPDATLLAFEINPRFTRYLKLTVSDPRLVLIDNAAQTVGQELQQRGFQRAEAVLSSLGLAFMPEAERDVFLGDLSSLLGTLTKRVPDGVGSDSLLPGESRRDGVLQRVMKLSEVRLDRSAITNSIIKCGHRCDTHPLRANQEG